MNESFFLSNSGVSLSNALLFSTSPESFFHSFAFSSIYAPRDTTFQFTRPPSELGPSNSWQSRCCRYGMVWYDMYLYLPPFLSAVQCKL